MQFQADILGIPIEKPVITEMTALGAAYLAGLGVGLWKGKEEFAANWKIDKMFEPKISQNQRERLYYGWKRAVERPLDGRSMSMSLHAERMKGGDPETHGVGSG